MRRIQIPTQRVRAVAALCASTILDEDLKIRIEAISDELEIAESNYEKCGFDETPHSIGSSTGVGEVTTDEMVELYNQRLSKKGHVARPIYDSLRGSSKYGICPLCAHRVVTTLDHYLAKTTHPDFAVTPVNLVPACSDCNKIKLNSHAVTADRQTLHPYFDMVDDAVWLKASVVETTPPAIFFQADPPAHWPEVKRQRVAWHFAKFGLGELYGVNAAQELAQIAGGLRDIFSTSGPNAVQQHLVRQSNSRREAEINSWQTAMYDAIAASHWFCTGGYRLNVP